MFCNFQDEVQKSPFSRTFKNLKTFSKKLKLFKEFTEPYYLNTNQINFTANIKAEHNSNSVKKTELKLN